MKNRKTRTKDKKLEQLFIRRNLSEKRKTTYYRTFKEIEELTGYTPTELLEVAKEEQQPRIQDNMIIFKELEDRTITEIQYDYYFSLKERGLKPSSIKTSLSTYRAFLNEYNIQLPKNIQVQVHPPLWEEGDLPQKEHILQAIQSTNNKRNKAIIYLMSSTGIRPIDIRNMRIQSFIDACKYYYDKETLTLEDIYDSDYEHLVPCFYFRPQKTSKHNNVCCTFCTPEAVKSILDYLKTRPIHSYDDPLFVSSSGSFMDEASFIQSFQRINDKEFGRTRDGERFFKPKHLRKYFIDTCNRNSGDLLKVRLLAGHSVSDIDRAYNSVSIPVMRRFYTTLIPYLSLNDTRVKDVKTQEYLALERKLERQELENRKLKEELDDKIASVVHNVLEKYK